MILIIGAMDEEVQALRELTDNPQSFEFEGIEVTLADLEGHKLLIAKSGIGKSAAAYTAAILCSHFRPRLLINIGSAGGLLEGQKVGDIVLSDCCRCHDFDIGEDTRTDARFAYHPRPEEVELAETILKNMGYTYHRGLIVTGDQFLQKRNTVYDHLKAWYPEAICAEMEAASVASVCVRNKTPFIVLRSISDLIFVEGNEMDFNAYLKMASERSARICREMVLAQKR